MTLLGAVLAVLVQGSVMGAVLEEKVLEEDIVDSPLAVKVKLRILVSGDLTEDALRQLLLRRYHRARASSGYKHAAHPTNVYIWLFDSEDRRPDEWVAMLAKNFGEADPTLEFNRTLLKPPAPATTREQVVGTWLDPSPFAGGVHTLYRDKGKARMEILFTDGSRSDEELIEEERGNQTILKRPRSSHGDYYIVGSDGRLGIYDNDGLIKHLNPR